MAIFSGYLLLMRIVKIFILILSLVELAHAQNSGSAGYGTALVKYARSLDSKVLNNWIDRTYKLRGNQIVNDLEFQKVLYGYCMVVYRNRKKDKNFGVPDGMPGGVPKNPPKFPLIFGGVGMNGSYAFPEKTSNESSSTPDMSSASGTGATANLMLMGNAMLTPINTVNLMYMYMPVTGDSPKASTKEIPEAMKKKMGGVTKPPMHMLTAGINQKFMDYWTGALNGGYSDSMGMGDPSLGLSYSSLKPKSFKSDFFWGVGVSASAGLSKVSKAQSKASTTTLKSSVSGMEQDWTCSLGLNYSYHFYTKEETAESLGMPSKSAMPKTPPSGGIPNGGRPPSSDLTLPDFNTMSRETARTTGSLNLSKALNRSWSAGFGGSLTYSYLESTYSYWSSSLTVAQVSYKVSQWTFSGNTTLNSARDQSMTAPAKLSFGLSIMYMFGPSGKGGMSANGGMMDAIPSMK